MNSYDCGVYVLWDIYCLTHHRAFQSIASFDLMAWQETLYLRLLSLDPYDWKRPKNAVPTDAEQIVISNSD